MAGSADEWSASWAAGLSDDGAQSTSAANGQGGFDMDGSLDDIPMPVGTSSAQQPNDNSNNNSAWAKAQQSLQKITGSGGSAQQTNSAAYPSYQEQQNADIRAQMLAAYPWMNPYGSAASSAYGYPGAGGMANNYSIPNSYNKQHAQAGFQAMPHYGGNLGSAPANYNTSSPMSQLMQSYNAQNNINTNTNKTTSSLAQQRFAFDSARRAQDTSSLSRSAYGTYNTTNATGTSGNGLASPSSFSRPAPYPPNNKSNLPPPGLVVPRLRGPSQNKGSIQFKLGQHKNNNQQQYSNTPNFASGANGEPLPDSMDSPLQQAASQRPTDPADTMPDGVKSYIERAYNQCECEAQKNRVEQLLKQKLTPLLQTGTAWQVTWATEALPLDPLFSVTQSSALGQSTGGMATRLNRPAQAQRGSLHNRLDGAGRNVFSNTAAPAHRSNKRRNVVHKHADNARWNRTSSRSGSVSSEGDTVSVSSSCSKQSSQNQGQTWHNKDPQNMTKNQRKKRNAAASKKIQAQFGADQADNAQSEHMKRRREARFAAHLKPNGAQRKPPRVLASRIDRRMVLGGDELDYDQYNNSNSPQYDLEELSNLHKITGTCDQLERPYFRLNSAPNPEDVRPEHVLRQSLEHVKAKYAKNGNYKYVCDQMKSMRQDLTIQCIANDLSVQVYETHARLALEKDDRNEFNQCQTQLTQLYRLLPACANEYEFTAYRLLYYIYMDNSLDMSTLIANLTAPARENECIVFALNVRKAWSLHSYHRLLRLYSTAPRMCSYIMDWFIDAQRKQALTTICKAYRPNVPVEFVSGQLGFDNVTECRLWIKQFELVFTKDTKQIDCKLSVLKLP